jgi:hypothetical protein
VKHSTEELIEIAYQYFPRGLWESDPRYQLTEEYGRRKAARERASADHEVWRTLLRHIQARFPVEQHPGRIVEDRSLFMKSTTAGPVDRCYSGALSILGRAPDAGEHQLGFAVSFVVPYYIVYLAREVRLDPPTGNQETRRDISFEPYPDELPFVRGIAEEVEIVFPGYEAMPPDVGNVILPDVDVLDASINVTLFDCLFNERR